MINWILTSSVLIALILLSRKIFGVKLTPGVQYGLWLLVLVRLLIPVNFFHSNYSLAAAADKVTIWVWEKNAEVETNMENFAGARSEEDIEDITYTPSDAKEVTDHTYVAAGREYDAESLFSGNRKLFCFFEFAKRISQSERNSLFYVIWLIGMAVTGGIFLLSNLFFRIRIYSDREEIEEELEKRGLFSRVPVYVSKFVATPCLAGLKTPAVYIPVRIWKEHTESASDSEKNNREKKDRDLEAMLCHENVHYLHGDQLWSFLRLVCLILHWYNPFVWAAALASRQDAELFCDAGTVQELGEENRYEYGRILLKMTTKEGHFEELRHAGFCNTEMADTKKHMERRIRKLAAMPDKSAIALTTLTLILGLTAFGYLFIGKEEQDSSFHKILMKSDTEQGQVVVTQSASQHEKISEETLFPDEEEVEAVRETALAGMSEGEIDALTDYVKTYHNWVEARLLYDNWEKKLSDKDNVVWNYIDQTGEIQAGWYLEDDPSYYLRVGEEEREYLQEKYPEYGTISLEELREKYGEPYYVENRYGAETVIQRMKDLTASAENETFRSDVENLCGTLQQAKDTHEVEYVMQAHEILHDMEYFLLRYSPRDVAPYTKDKSLSCKYYGVLEVWTAWREGQL